MKSAEDIVSLNDSQVLRFIDELNGATDAEAKARSIKRRLKLERKRPKTRETSMKIRELYNALYDLQHQKDYVCIIMDSVADYHRLNKGFTINNIEYRRFLGTAGGIKKSTIVYVSKELYPELKKRLDNGRNMNTKLVPAKLEAYQALICSASIPVPEPKGIIVVDDCITNFTDDVIVLDDSESDEPAMKFVTGKEISHNNSDGCGFILPAYAMKVNGELNGDYETPLSGFNCRYAWTKGMLYTFDFIDFAENVAHTYYVTDAWGHQRDVRDAEVILTTSMLKLWNCYDSWEDFYHNCQENHYQFSATKTTPDELEHVRNMNYQFLQSYKLTDEELQELCQPTIDEIHDILGGDVRKTITFLAGFGLNEKNIANYDNGFVKALMIDNRLMDDPYVRRKVNNMIRTRIDMAKKGSIMVNGNFAMISGDLYGLAQSMFGMEVTGLLKTGEIYHRYWLDMDTDEIVCFRAPMTCHNNIRKLKLHRSQEADYWFKYIKTAIILNAWDTTCDAMNGCDFDGDTFFTTDNEILLDKTLNSPTIMCVQRNAEKIVPAEDDIITANILGFGDEIGSVTNHITSMIERQSEFDEDSHEYEVLSYRIMCGQLYQQNTIDRAKGIVAKPMPNSWYSRYPNKLTEDDTAETINQKQLNMRLLADKKPYFMTYVYPKLRKEYNDYIKNASHKARLIFGKSIDDLRDDPSQDAQSFIDRYDSNMPVGINACVVNRISWLLESEFKQIRRIKEDIDGYDYEFMKSGVNYSTSDYRKIKALYSEFRDGIKRCWDSYHSYCGDKQELITSISVIMDNFKRDCYLLCPNAKDLCDIVLDLCYTSETSKEFAWEICGDEIIDNLLQKNNGVISYPERVDAAGDFTYNGMSFATKQASLLTREESNDCIE